jgi:hypothetical protein
MLYLPTIPMLVKPMLVIFMLVITMLVILMLVVLLVEKSNKLEVLLFTNALGRHVNVQTHKNS